MTRLCAILAGGEGRRMGGRKPLRPWGQATLIGAALALARRQAAEVVVALRTPGQAGEIDAPVVLDDPDVEGPLAGLAAALKHAREIGCDVVLTLPCDMPRLPEDLGERLARALEADPQALAAVARTGDDLHPVCAAWRVSALDRLPAYLASGRRSLRGFAELCGAATVDWPLGLHPLFANANTPEELAALARQAA
jgi:molybdopterin-guanine dinucleotide biosynthesis protein A